MADEYLKTLQEYYAVGPTIIVGSGASAALGIPGMPDLADHLIDTVTPEPGYIESWTRCVELLRSGTDLESTLNEVRLEPSTSSQVVRATWSLINREDSRVFKRSMIDPDFFALSELFTGMFRSALTTINVVTPNYDRLIEYACEQARLHHYTGFSAGYFRTPASPDSLKCARDVRIWKVHGSIDWFKIPSGETCALGPLSDIPKGMVPQIVTPGIEKYQRAHQEPYRTTMTAADDALEKARSFLCIGYGFNDEHIQEKLVSACTRERRPVIVITKSLSEMAKRFLFTGQVLNYVAIEADPSNPDHSLVHVPSSPKPILAQADYWSLRGFLRAIT